MKKRLVTLLKPKEKSNCNQDLFFLGITSVINIKYTPKINKKIKKIFIIAMPSQTLGLILFVCKQAFGANCCVLLNNYAKRIISMRVRVTLFLN